MLGFKYFYTAQKILANVELIRIFKKGQMRETRGDLLSPAGQFSNSVMNRGVTDILYAWSQFADRTPIISVQSIKEIF